MSSYPYNEHKSRMPNDRSYNSQYSDDNNQYNPYTNNNNNNYQQQRDQYGQQYNQQHQYNPNQYNPYGYEQHTTTDDSHMYPGIKNDEKNMDGYITKLDTPEDGIPGGMTTISVLVVVSNKRNINEVIHWKVGNDLIVLAKGNSSV